MEQVICLSVEIKTNLPIEAVKEHLAVYCEKMGDVKVTEITIERKGENNGI